MLIDIEAAATRVCGRDGWRRRVPDALLRDANQWRGYKGRLRDLLRLIRNKAHHVRCRYLLALACVHLTVVSIVSSENCQTRYACA